MSTKTVRDKPCVYASLNDKYYDTTILFEGYQFNVHRSIICGASSVFDELYAEAPLHEKKAILHIRGNFDAPTFARVIATIYGINFGYHDKEISLAPASSDLFYLVPIIGDYGLYEPKSVPGATPVANIIDSSSDLVRYGIEDITSKVNDLDIGSDDALSPPVARAHAWLRIYHAANALKIGGLGDTSCDKLKEASVAAIGEDDFIDICAAAFGNSPSHLKNETRKIDSKRITKDNACKAIASACAENIVALLQRQSFRRFLLHRDPLAYLILTHLSDCLVPSKSQGETLQEAKDVHNSLKLAKQSLGHLEGDLLRVEKELTRVDADHNKTISSLNSSTTLSSYSVGRYEQQLKDEISILRHEKENIRNDRDDQRHTAQQLQCRAEELGRKLNLATTLAMEQQNQAARLHQAKEKFSRLKNESIKFMEEYIKSKEQCIGLDKTVKALSVEVTEGKQTIGSLRAELAGRDAIVANLRSNLASKNAIVANDRPEPGSIESAVAVYKTELARKDAIIASLRNELTKQENTETQSNSSSAPVAPATNGAHITPQPTQHSHGRSGPLTFFQKNSQTAERQQAASIASSSQTSAPLGNISATDNTGSTTIRGTNTPTNYGLTDSGNIFPRTGNIPTGPLSGLSPDDYRSPASRGPHESPAVIKARNTALQSELTAKDSEIAGLNQRLAAARRDNVSRPATNTHANIVLQSELAIKNAEIARLQQTVAAIRRDNAPGHATNIRPIANISSSRPPIRHHFEPTQSRLPVHEVRQRERFVDVLNDAQFNHKVCNDCSFDINMQWRGVTEDRNKNYLSLRCNGCEAEIHRWAV